MKLPKSCRKSRGGGRLSAFLAVLIGCAAPTATQAFTLKNNVSNWASADSYEENDVPSSGDLVNLPSGRTVTLDSSDNTSWALVESLQRIVPSGTNSVLVVDVASGDAMLTVPFSSSNVNDASHTNGCLRKTGAGNLFLGAQDGSRRYAGNTATEGYDYFARIDVVAGSVSFPQQVDRAGVFRYGALHIAAGAVVSNLAVKSGASVWPNIQVRSLSGSGTVTCSGSRPLQVAGTGAEASVFDGKISGSLIVYQNGEGTYTSVLSDSTGAFQTRTNYDRLREKNAGGIAHIVSFGGAGEPSSVGANRMEVGQYGGGFVYEGTVGETVGKSLWLRDTVSEPGYAFIDGGMHGGLEWAGSWEQNSYNGDETKTHRVLLMGSHANECVMSGKFADTYYSGVMYPIYVVKRGSGIWRMADNANRTCGGGYAIEEGTLRYDSIAEKGTVCSLGTATNLTDNYTGRDLENHRKDYAYLLGSSGGATMEFSGSNGGTCSTRPVAVKGRGRFKVSGAGTFSFSGFTAHEPGAELILDTDRTDGDVLIGGIADGAASLDVSKEGTGTVALTGVQSFTGDLAVRTGTLVVRGYKREKYTWFRWTIKESATHCSRYAGMFNITGTDQLKMMMQEFALFDEDGKRVNLGHAENRDAQSDVASLSPGEATIQGASWPTVGGKLGELYNGVQWASGADWYGMAISSGNWPGYRLSVPASYKYVVERLPAGANEVASYDLAYSYGTNEVAKGGWGVTAFSLEGSTDGIHWSAPIVDRSDCEIPYANFRWLSSPDSALNTHRGMKDGNNVTFFDDHKGFAIDGYSSSGTSNIIATASTVSVAAGATLRADGVVTISSLRLSPSGNGTIDGFSFAENGVFDVAADKVSRVTELPVTFANCTGVQSLSQWTLKIGGKVAPRHTLKVSATGTLRVVPPGLILVVE